VTSRQSYEGVALTVPVTVPYMRYSTHGAHWFIGQALRALVQESGIAKEQIDGLTVSSFSLSPDTAVGVTQHLGLSPRWLDHIPTGGASGVRGTVASAGFGNGVAVQGGGGPGGNAAMGRVRSGGFTAATAPAANPEEMRQRRAAASAAPASAPVSIQSKPTPVYTAEARQLKIEGEVLLNVVFTADGHIRVLNVVRGLGHGLDEAAQRAAQGIRFNPATRDGQTVDSTAVLHIIFQLS